MTLNERMRGLDVRIWQAFLINKGYMAGDADGDFGPATKEASIKFQQKHGLKGDGVVGPKTVRAAMQEGFDPTAAPSFPPLGTTNTVIDISHHNGPSPDFAQAKAFGIKAVIHKASQGTHLTDKMYAPNRLAAAAQGLLWGAYHFGDGSDPVAQADFFLQNAKPDTKTLLVLDFEENPFGSTMTLDQARKFVQRIHTKTGKYPGLYGGSLIRQSLNGKADAVLSKCWLWFARYGALSSLPPGWPSWTMWQYTDGANGPSPVPVPGIGVCDRDLFNGSATALRVFWGQHGV